MWYTMLWIRTATSEHSIFADIDVQMQQYTFSQLAGLLFATQFVQIALAIT
jgi:hypothetical protein